MEDDGERKYGRPKKRCFVRLRRDKVETIVTREKMMDRGVWRTRIHEASHPESFPQFKLALVQLGTKVVEEEDEE